jgi:hypothetical protein
VDRNPGGRHARPLNEIASQWMAPTAEHHGPDMVRRDTLRPNSNLNTQVALWYAPDVPNGGRTMPDRATAKGATDKGKRQVGLENQAAMWPTQTSLSFDGSHQPGNSRSSNRTLELASTLQALKISTPGQQLWPARRVSLRLYRMLMSPRCPDWRRLVRWARRSTRRKLNPSFVEWLMGWPPGWTSSECSVTAFIHWRSAMASALSSMSTPPGVTPAQLSLFG